MGNKDKLSMEERKEIAKHLRQNSDPKTRKSESDKVSSNAVPVVKLQRSSSVQEQLIYSSKMRRNPKVQFPRQDSSYHERRNSIEYQQIRRNSTTGTIHVVNVTTATTLPESEDDDTDDKEPIAPDGGYGWVVMIASFFASVIVDGVCFAFGIFYLEFLETFQEDRSKTAWIGSVLNGMYMVTAPVAGALAKKFGCRPVAMVGSIWAAIAFICSTFSKGVNALILTYGVLGGIGFGLMYLPSIVMVAAYFDKKRAFATGIATCGSGIGAFVFAPLCKTLIELYGWQGAQWVVAGLVFNGVLLGALYRPLTGREMERYKERWRKRKYSGSYSESLVEESPQETIKQGLNILCEDDEQFMSASDREITKGHQYAKNGVISGSLYSLTSISSVGKQPINGKTRSPAREIIDNIVETMDVSVLKNPVFDIYGFSCILCMAGFFVPFTYLPDHCLRLGYTKAQGALLLSILGITNTVGRILAGWLSDRSWADCLLINNIALIIGGLGTIACPFCNTYVLLCIYSCVFGLCIAAFVSLRSIILVDLIGLERLTSSFGLLVLCQGISSFFGSPLAGFLYDVTDSYDLSFYVAGTVIALAGVICLPLRRLAACQDKQ